MKFMKSELDKIYWTTEETMINLKQLDSVGTATDYGLDYQGSIPGKGKSFLFSIFSGSALGPTQLPIRWIPGALSLGLKLVTLFHLLPRSRMMELYLHSPTCIHGIVLN
jgi:hypothetical protein